MLLRRLLVPFAALIALGVPDVALGAVERLTPVGAGVPVELVGSSGDGQRVIFTTSASLVPADTDVKLDVYERFAGAVTLLSTGPDGGNGAFDAIGRGVSEDGTHVFFETAERLSASADTDVQVDVYEHDASGTHWRSAGNGAFPATFVKTSDDGAQLYFRTNEQLVGADTDTGTDLYRRTDSGLSVLSEFSNIQPYEFALSHDGSRIVFDSVYPFDADNDPIIINGAGYMDVFSRAFEGPTTLLSAGAQNNDAPDGARFIAASRDATNVVFATNIAFSSADTDTTEDLYQRTDAGTRLLTAPDAVFPGEPVSIPSFEAISAGGGRVLFSTDEKLTPGDDDHQEDVFLTSLGLGEDRRLVSTGLSGGQGAFPAYPVGLSADGSHAYFETAERLRDDDDDPNAIDVYENDGITTRLVSTGAGAGAADAAASHYVGSSPDGKRTYFTTSARLAAEDTDASVDLYVREAGATTLLSLGSVGGNGAFDVAARGVSADGDRAFFRSAEGLNDAAPGGWNLYAAGAPAVTPAPTPTQQPSPTPSPTPTPTPVTVKDTVKPKISFALVKGQKLKGVLKLGALRLRVGCDEACRIAIGAELAGGSKTAAKRRPVRLGTLTVRLTTKGTKAVRLKLTKAGKAALGKAGRSASLTLRLTATDSAGNRRTMTSRLTLRR